MLVKKFISAVLVGAISLSAAPAMAPSRAPYPPARSQSPHRYSPPKMQISDTLDIKQPKFGASLSGDSINAKLRVGYNISPRSMEIRLNGRDVTDKFYRGSCNGEGCQQIATLYSADGLRNGNNRLTVVGRAFNRHIEYDHVRFNYSDGLLGTTNQPHWLPQSLGFQTVLPNGFVKVTTGTPAGLQDAIDQTQYSTPYPDTVFPKSTDATCDHYQVLELERQNPLNEIAYTCYEDAPSMNAYLTNLAKTPGTEIVVAGTVQGIVAADDLDTSSIGGTNFANTPANKTPQGYLVIGVPGAKAGTAFESYYTSSDRPYQYAQFARGTLNLDLNGNYNFLAGDNRYFSVTPDDSNAGTSVVNIGGQIYTPPSGSRNGFWLLQIDRVLLQPVDAFSSTTGCSYDADSVAGCGVFYNTGSNTQTVAQQAIDSLTTAINSVDPRSLGILVTVGSPYPTDVNVIDNNFLAALQAAGGAVNSILAQPTINYSLVFHGIGTTVAPATGTSETSGTSGGLLGPQSPFAPGVAFSSSLYSAQGQTGAIAGVLSRGRQGLFAPSLTSQGVNGPGIVPDYSFQNIIGRDSVDWPLTDTAAHIAAYHYASYYFLNNHYKESGLYSRDIRYFYPSKTDIGQYNTDFLKASNFYPPYPGASSGFTSQDLDDACAQLYNELTAMNDMYGYLGLGGLESLMVGDAKNPGMADTVIGVAHTILNGEFGANSGTPVSSSVGNWMNLVAGLASTPATGLGILELPEGAAALGIVSGIMWTGSAMAPILGDTNSPPSAESTFDTTLGQLDSEADTNETNLVKSYVQSLNMIYCDWGRLNAVFSKTSDSGSGWSFNSGLDILKFGNTLANGAARSLYLNILPELYQLDTFVAVPGIDYTKIGMYQVHDDGTRWNTCNPVPNYSSLTADGYAYADRFEVTPSLDDTRTFYVLGGTISNQATLQVSEQMPSQSLTTTLTHAPVTDDGSTSGYLNIPRDYLYNGSGFLTVRPGPNMGQGNCFKAPCTNTKDGACEGY